MYFETFSQLLQMDGHGAFVWSAYAIAAVVIAGCIVIPQQRYRKELRRLAARGALQQRDAAPLPDGEGSR